MVSSEVSGVCGVIPARYASSRFPGKPLCKLNGKEMILHVIDRASSSLGAENVYVATDDKRISKVVEKYGGNVIQTSQECLTGTDRVAEAALHLRDYERILNIQGDEPVVNPDFIRRVAQISREKPGVVVNGFAYIDAGIGEDPNIPKIVTDESGYLLYMSRAMIPSCKKSGLELNRLKKQVCVYAYTHSQLEKFYALKAKSYLERIEDIEILRFFELGIRVLMCEDESQISVAVDVPEDIPAAEYALRTIY